MVDEERKRQINNIIDIIGNNGEQIDIFNLHGILYLGNTKDSVFDIDQRYTMFSEHSLGISVEDFEYAETEDEILEKFGELLEDQITRLL